MSSTRSRAATVFRSLILLIARLGFAALLLSRAWYRWQIEGLTAQTERLTQAGLPHPGLLATATPLLEAAVGAMLALGLLTRFVALLAAVENALIVGWLKWPAGIYLTDGGFEYNLALALLGLVFLAVGAHHAGLDTVLLGRGRRRDGEETEELYQPRLGSTEI